MPVSAPRLRMGARLKRLSSSLKGQHQHPGKASSREMLRVLDRDCGHTACHGSSWGCPLPVSQLTRPLRSQGKRRFPKTLPDSLASPIPKECPLRSEVASVPNNLPMADKTMSFTGLFLKQTLACAKMQLFQMPVGGHIK